jgi:glycosyltransferase involved in cell wall biosynthesis
VSKVFIGMPVYNGAKFVHEAINSLLAQTYKDWRLFISDNASEDETHNICLRYTDLDNRITYFRQENNIGAVANYKFVLNKADSEYFMWAAADDYWHNEFLESCIKQLEPDKTFGMAFCNIVNIDSFGRVIRGYPDFSMFTGDDRYAVLTKYLYEPEVMGKANIIYSIYRLEICREAWNTFPLSADWGADYCFVLAALARTKLAVNSRVLFSKRLVRPADAIEKIDYIEIDNPQKYIFPLNLSAQYLINHLKAVWHTPYYDLTMKIMKDRIKQAEKRGES